MKNLIIITSLIILLCIITFLFYTYKNPKYCGSFATIPYHNYKDCDCLGVIKSDIMEGSTTEYCYGFILAKYKIQYKCDKDDEHNCIETKIKY